MLPKFSTVNICCLVYICISSFWVIQFCYIFLCNRYKSFLKFQMALIFNTLNLIYITSIIKNNWIKINSINYYFYHPIIVSLQKLHEITQTVMWTPTVTTVTAFSFGNPFWFWYPGVIKLTTANTTVWRIFRFLDKYV